MTKEERAEIEKIYEELCESKPVMEASKKVQDAYAALSKLFDDYEAESVVDAFCWGYYYGRASK